MNRLYTCSILCHTTATDCVFFFPVFVFLFSYTSSIAGTLRVRVQHIKTKQISNVFLF